MASTATPLTGSRPRLLICAGTPRQVYPKPDPGTVSPHNAANQSGAALLAAPAESNLVTTRNPNKESRLYNSQLEKLSVSAANNPSEKPAVPRDYTIEPFADRRYPRRPAVKPQHPAPVRGERQYAKDRFGGLTNLAVRANELHRTGEGCGRNLGEAACGFLKWRVYDALARERTPALDPGSAEAAVTVENEQRLGWGRRDTNPGSSSSHS